MPGHDSCWGGGHDSCWGGNDSGCGGGNPPMSCPPSFRCEGCGETYSARCKCNGRFQPCPVCALPVYWTAGKPDPHACGERRHQPEGWAFLLKLSDFAANELCRARLEGFEEGYAKGVRDSAS